METNDNKLQFDSITQLVNHYENEALSIDLKDKAPQLYNVLQSQKLKANEVENENELKEAKDFCTKAVSTLKHKLSNVLINENYKVKANFTDFYIFEIRQYLEYKELINKLNDLSTKFKRELIFNNTLFYYTSTRFNAENLQHFFIKKFNSDEEFKGMLFKENSRVFFRYAITLKNEDFVNFINNEFILFKNYNKANDELKINWLKNTYNYILEKDNTQATLINKPTVVKFISWYENELDILQPVDLFNKPEKQKKRHKTLFEFINNIDDKEAFLNDLKNTFPTEIGLSIKAIVLRLVEVNILIYGTKEFKNFYEELTKYFDRSIGTYGSINDNKPDNRIIDTITLKLNPLIDKYKTK